MSSVSNADRITGDQILVQTHHAELIHYYSHRLLNTVTWPFLKSGWGTWLFLHVTWASKRHMTYVIPLFRHAICGLGKNRALQEAISPPNFIK